MSAEVLDLREEGFHFSRLTNEQLHFAYRESSIKQEKKLLVMSALFGMHAANDTEFDQAQEVAAKNILYRKEHHPIEYPTCGSVFKNIRDQKNVQKVLTIWPDTQEFITDRWHGKVSMGYIIKRLGFSGYRIGNMEVSTKHSNFIINLGEGKAADVLTIIGHIQEKVSETFGFMPEVEVEIVH